MSQRTNQRGAFIKSATGLFHQRGFQGTGVDQVIAGAGGSKGSFYHHFKSKEDLGRAVLDAGAEKLITSVEERLWDPSLPPVDRLLRMIERATITQERTGFRRGCLFGNLAAELSGTNESMRRHLAAIFARWMCAIAKTLREAQARGELPAAYDPDRLAHFILSSLEGAILCAKVDRSPRPLDDCRHYLGLLLGRPADPEAGPEPTV